MPGLRATLLGVFHWNALRRNTIGGQSQLWVVCAVNCTHSKARVQSIQSTAQNQQQPKRSLWWKIIHTSRWPVPSSSKEQAPLQWKKPELNANNQPDNQLLTSSPKPAISRSSFSKWLLVPLFASKKPHAHWCQDRKLAQLPGTSCCSWFSYICPHKERHDNITVN